MKRAPLKRVFALLLFAGSLSAQNAIANLPIGQIAEIDQNSGTTQQGVFWARELIYRIQVVDHQKTLQWYIEFCSYPPLGFQFADEGNCVDYNESDVEGYPAVNDLLAAFYSAYPDGDDQYGAFPLPASQIRKALTTVTPVTPPDPEMIFLNGLGNTLMAVDMTNFATVSQVVVPSTSGPLAIRPTPTPPAQEVWVANGGLQVSVANLGAQTLVTNILTPSIPPGSTTAGIVFTPDGTTAFEAVGYPSADSSGNNGALVVFDAVGRTVSSTVPLKNAPAALLMAPDGSTAYILGSSGGSLTYYDVLSGTAGLTISTDAPGSSAGYPGAGTAVYIHPDGTRLFWNVGVYLVSFNLTTHTATNMFNSGLPTTVARTFTLSQDGGRAYFSDGQGDVAILDTYFGNVLSSFTVPGTSNGVVGGAPVAP